MTLSLFEDPKPPTVPGIDLRCAPASALFARGLAAHLVTADPPWSEYTQRPGTAAPELHYPVMSLDDIGADLDSAYDCTLPGGRLALWTCWPLLEKTLDMMRETRWGPLVSGGAWVKTHSQGVGFHWLGRSEVVLMYIRKGGTPFTHRGENLGNAYVSPRSQHSEKPTSWEAAWLRRWVPPNGLCLDLYAGLAPMARACHATGRRYIGAEIDPDRHHQAMCRLALARE